MQRGVSLWRLQEVMQSKRLLTLRLLLNMASLSFSRAQQLVWLQVLIWNYFCAPGAEPRSGHAFHQRRKFLRMTITDAVNPHNSDRGFLSKLGSNKSLFPCVCVEGGETQILTEYQGSFLFSFGTFFNKTTHPPADTLNPPMLHKWSLRGIFLSLFSPLEVAEEGHPGRCWMWDYGITSDFCKPPFL